jgi:hypothetical protein
LLAAELEAQKAAVAQQVPERGFGIGLFGPQASGEVEQIRGPPNL